MLNIHTAHITHLPKEEFRDIHNLNGDRCSEPWTQSPMWIELHVFGAEAANRDGPKHHAHATIRKELHIPIKESRIELHSLKRSEIIQCVRVLSTNKTL